MIDISTYLIEKDNYGDLTFSLIDPNTLRDTHNRQARREEKYLTETKLMHTITFYAIENIGEICKLAKETQSKLANINQNQNNI